MSKFENYEILKSDANLDDVKHPGTYITEPSYVQPQFKESKTIDLNEVAEIIKKEGLK